MGGNSWFDSRGSVPTLFGGALVGIAILVEGLWPNATALLIIFLVGGLGNGLRNTGVRTAIYEHVPQARHGSAWAQLRMLINAMVALGYLLGTPGLIMNSAQMIIILTGAGTALSVVVALVLSRKTATHNAARAAELN